MGRLASITHPSESQLGVCDTTTWTQTTSSFVKVPAIEVQYGLPLGHWRHTVTTGARKKETFYDAFWRPILTRESTTDSSAGVRAVRRLFDWSHREVFASYPIDTFTLYTDAAFNVGTDTVYDPLGRVTGTAVDSELGGVDSVLETYTSYANGQTVHTNARGYATTTTYQAFDQPSLDAPMTITAPESITTSYTRDLFGKPLTLSRTGTYTPPGGVAENLSVTRRFVYEPQYQRLCKTIEPDAGITVIDYDAAGNVAWRSTGRAALTSTTDCQRASVLVADKSVNAYDALNRLLWINHPDGTSDVGYSYAPDGAMLTASVSATANAAAPPFASPLNTWTYTYKRRRLLESETLALDGKTFPLTWSYHARGDVSGLTYPSGHAVTFNPNAYGEPRQVGTYATGATYHSYGGLAGFNYGNGATRAIAKNTRQLPSQILDTRSGTTLLSHTLAYDQNGNLKGLTDGAPGAPESRTFTYDQRDRLTAVTLATAGNETYAYDVLDNVRRSVIGGVDRRFKVTPATNRLLEVTREGSVEKTTYAWNDRGELTTRTRVTPGTTTVTPPTVFRSGFEELTNSYPESLAFDQAGRLVTFNTQVAHQYDAHNRRVRTAITAEGTRYQVYSKAGELLYVDDSILRRRTDYLHLNGVLVADRSRPLAPDETVTIRYQHSDHRGTPLVKTLNTGAVEAGSYKRLSPFGTSYENVYLDEPGFTKHLTDGVSSMSYMQQRYYDPNMAGFISPDPVGPNHFGFSRYAYANNNPYTFVDPDGRAGRLATALGSGVIEEAAIQYATTGTVNVGQVFLDAAKGTVNPLKKVQRVAKAVKAVTNRSRRGGNITENAAKGKEGEAITRNNLGDDVAGEQVTFITSDGTRTRADFVTRKRDVVETKTGDAQLSPGQEKLKADIDAGREVTPVGGNATKSGLPSGQPTKMNSCTVDRHDC
jgi:RHS repeat-associated protein